MAMASLLSGIGGKLLGELGAPFLQKVVKSWGFGAKNEFKRLESTLTSIDALLSDAEEDQKTNHQLQDWLKKIKLAFYDIEDLLLEISTEALKRQLMRTKNKKAKKVLIFFSLSKQVVYRLKMGSKVKSIRENLDAIASDHEKFKLPKSQLEKHVVNSSSNESHSFVPLRNVVGRDIDRICVAEHLFESDDKNNVSVISIVGFGGLGKTTLAKSVYDLEKVKDCFKLMMWVHVSNVFDLKLICENIIESATGSQCSSSQLERVQKELRDAIDGNKYLLVLDDVWNESTNKWMDLAELLTGGAKGSKILITTRTQLVAQTAKSTTIHFLKGLSHEDSWSLFKQVAFEGGVEAESSAILGIGEEIAEKCAGVPLTIKTIGGMLGRQKNEKYWLNFLKHDLPRITQDGEGEILSVLKLSYNCLPAPLKRCFAYCAVFSKNFTIEKKSLIWMWMAHGLVQPDGTTRSLEDVGDQYVTELLDRSFIEFDSWQTLDNITYYKMHDLIHDLANSVGGNECCDLHLHASGVDENTRHVSVGKSIPVNLFCAKKLRTLLTHKTHLDEPAFSKILSSFKHMRVLYLEGSKMMSTLHCIGKLRYLSYLNLSLTGYDVIPESVCNLYNLQTLILKGCSNLKELPRGIGNLVSLRHLVVSGCDNLGYMPRGLAELTGLQTLNAFVMGPQDRNDCIHLGELKRFVNLSGSLYIRRLRGLSKYEKCKRDGQSCHPPDLFLIQLEFVEFLSLEWSRTNEHDKAEEEEDAAEELLLFESLKPHHNLWVLGIKGYGGKRFPSWMDRVDIGVSLPNISFIELSHCKGWRHVAQLGLLPSLNRLFLTSMSGTEYICDDDEAADHQNNIVSSSTSGSAGGASCSTSKAPHHQLFPFLKLLQLKNMPKLMKLFGPKATSHPRNNNRCFPVLEMLRITNCPLFFADGSHDDRKQILSLTSLAHLEFFDSKDMETLPLWLQYLPSLQSLRLSYCPNIVTLPEWIGNLTSLEEVYLYICKSLESIPDYMRPPTSLPKLVVRDCPKLPT